MEKQTEKKCQETLKEFSFFVLPLSLFIALVILCNFSELKEVNIRSFASGFITANIFCFIVFVVNNKPHWILKLKFDSDCYILDLALYLIFFLIILIFLFLAFYIIDYEFINESLNFFSINYQFNKPAYLTKLSFIVTSSILYYFYSKINNPEQKITTMELHAFGSKQTDIKQYEPKRGD